MNNVSGISHSSQVLQTALPRAANTAPKATSTTGNSPAAQVTISTAAQQLSQAAATSRGDQDHDGDSK